VHAGADGKALADRAPRVRHDLLHAEGHALALGVVLEDDDLHVIADVHDLGGMADARPRHVCDVEEAVDAAEVDEGTVVSDVLHRALEDDALLEHLERLRLELRPLALQHRAPRHDHVAARAVELQDREAPALADVAIEVAGGAQIGVRAREERGDADVDLEAALHLADDGTLDRALRFEGAFDVAPHDELQRLLA
jgi:hypothetical protein